MSLIGHTVTSLSVTVFLVILLCFTDGMGLKKIVFQQHRRFYVRKVAWGVIYFLLDVCFKFSLYSNGTRLMFRIHLSNDVVNADQWSGEFALFLTIVLTLHTIWVIVYAGWFVGCLCRTRRAFRELPYLEFRYQHLICGLFYFQCMVGMLLFVITSVYIFTTQYPVFRFKGSAFHVNYFNILFRIWANSTTTWWLRGIVIVTCGIMAFLIFFLPINFGSRIISEKFRERIGIEYVYVEGQAHLAKFVRQNSTRNFQLDVEDEEKRINKVPIFCVETACWMLELSELVYYDEPYDEPLRRSKEDLEDERFEKLAFTRAQHIIDENLDIHAIIYKNEFLNIIAIVFRGTVNSKHWSTNLNMRQKEFNLDILQIAGEEELIDDSILLPLSEWPEWFPSILDAKYNSNSTADWEHDWEHEEVMEYINAVLKAADSDEGIGSVRRKNAAGTLMNNAAHAVGLDKVHGLNKLLFGHVHCGFWRAYESMRTRVHAGVRRILLDMILKGMRPKLYVGGHSMGGSLATHCALDLQVHTLSKVNAVNWKQVLWTIAIDLHAAGANNGDFMERGKHKFGIISQSSHSAFKESGSHFFDMPPKSQSDDWDFFNGWKLFVSLQVYTFGQPRVGNIRFANTFNELVPCAFRIVCDGDPVSYIPKFWHKHGGKKVLIGKTESGKLIMNPTFIENRFVLEHTPSYESHQTKSYRRGLRGNFMLAFPENVAKQFPPEWPFGMTPHL